MNFHPKEFRRLARMQKFDQKCGDKYCWAQLAWIAMIKYDPDEELDSYKNSARNHNCKIDSVENGRCRCGKFANGELNKAEQIEEETP